MTLRFHIGMAFKWGTWGRNGCPEEEVVLGDENEVGHVWASVHGDLLT